MPKANANSNNTSESHAKSRKQKRKPQHIAVPSLPQHRPVQDEREVSSGSQDSVAAPIYVSESQHNAGPLRFSQANQPYGPEEIDEHNRMTVLYFEIKTPIYVPMLIFEGLKESHTGGDSRRRITKHVHEQFTTRMVDAALGWAEQANPSSILPAKCHPNDEALSSVDEDFLPPTPISSLLSLPNPVELENDMDVVSSASPITLIETQERCVYPTSKDSAPSHPVVLVEGPLQHHILTNFDEDPTQLEHPGLLTVPEPASTISDSARSAEYSTPSPKTPSTLGPLAYPPSSPLPSPPSSPPSALRTTLGLGLHLGRPESQVAPPSDSTASPNVSPIVKTHTLRKSRPDSSEYFLSPPIELASGRHKFTTDKISDLPNHFVPLPAPLPFAEGLPDDIISAPKRRSPTTKSTTQSIDTKDESEPPKAWLKIRLYDEPDSSDFEQENWEVTLDTTNLLKPSVWDQGYTYWEEKGAVTLLAKNRQLPWKCLAPYLLKDKPICLYRRPMGRFDLALHKGLGLMLNLVGLILLFWQPWRKDFWSSSCAVLANVLPMLGQWVLRLEKRSGERTVDPFLNSINQLDPRRVF